MSSRKDVKRASQAVKAQARAEKRRRRTVGIAVVVAALVVIGGGTTAAILAAQHRATSSSHYALPAGTTRDAPGLVVGSGPTTVDLYLDFDCSDCKEFETLAGSVLSSASTAGTVRVVYHPLNVLDAQSKGFSTRAAAAAGCAADAGKLPDFVNAVYGVQPAPHAAGPTNAQIAKAGSDAGITDAGFTKCVTSQKYADWVRHATNDAAANDVTTTPTVLVGGKKIQATASALTMAINNAQ